MAPSARTDWQRAVAVSAAVFAVVAAAAALWLRSSDRPSGAGVVLSATDYRFSPSRIVWRSGRRVTLTIANDSKANPGKPHELMVGRRPLVDSTPFGTRPGDGYVDDFFAGVRVRVVAARGLTMLMPGRATVVGAAARRYLGGMPGMTMPGMKMPGMKMPGMKMPGTTMPGMTMPGSASASQGGLMFVLRPGGSVTLSFVVPDRPGAWEMGCFQGNGEHYANGMRGTIDVVGG